MRWWRSARRRLLLMIPTDCPMCGGPAAGGHPCAGCLADVVATMHPEQPRCPHCALRLRSPQAPCPDCARRRLPLAGVFAGFDYDCPGDMLMTRYKGQGRHALAGPLADMILRSLGGPASRAQRADGLTGLPAALPADTVLVPIPSSRASLRRRGFNPAAELARALAQRTGLPRQARWLLRGREGPKQSSLTRQARLRLAPDAYRCPVAVPPCTIALVDDVMTTGSTLHAAALALRSAGAGRIIALVAARAPTHDDGGLGSCLDGA